MVVLGNPENGSLEKHVWLLYFEEIKEPQSNDSSIYVWF
jgi:hypothetical protein